MLRNFILLLGLLISSWNLSAQNVEIEPTITPEFFSASEQITITYDVTGTGLHNLSDAWIWVWTPSSQNANIPSNVNPANSNTALSNAAKFTRTEDNGKVLFTTQLTPVDFVGLPENEIKDLGMLIKGNDWGDGQSVDYVVDVGNEFRVLFDNPEGDFAFYEAGETIDIQMRSSATADLELFVDNTLLAFASQTNSLQYDHLVINDGEIHDILAIGATSFGDMDTLIYKYAVPPSAPIVSLPAEVRDGINYYADPTKATLVLLAPEKNNVYLIGDFNDWTIDNDYLLNKAEDGERFWITLDNLIPGKEYRFQYLVDGVLRVADPYTEKMSSSFDDPQVIAENRYPGLLGYPDNKTSEGVAYLQTDQQEYDWSDAGFQRPDKEDLMIYELLIRDFTEDRTFQAVIDRLDYLEGLGINAIELMPVMEFEGNLSWGYNPAFMFSVDKFYGTENKLKELIDEAHQRGMAIILDIVLNHAFGRCPLVRLYNDDLYGPPTNDNPWLNRTAKHDYNVGYDFNHESLYTQDYVDRVNEFWIKEYHIDGFRFDLSKGFTQKNTLGDVGAWGAYDASRIALLKRMADKIWGNDPNNFIILEHFADNSEEEELADYGMLIWGNMVGAYRSAARGNSSNFHWLNHEARGFDEPNVVGYMESHDEERVMYEVLDRGDFSLAEAAERLKANAAFFFLVPGPKMIWQFEEVGYDEELNNDRLGIKPPHWEYQDDPDRSKLREVYASLMNLRKQTGFVDEDYFSWSPNEYFKWINIDHPEVKIAAFGNFRKDKDLEESVPFPTSGTWYNYFSGKELLVEDHLNYSMTLKPGEMQMYTSSPIENYIDGNPLKDWTGFVAEIDELKVFPSPTEDLLTIQYPPGVDRLYIYDSLGKLMDVIEAEVGDAQQTEYSTLDYPLGAYIIFAEFAGERHVQKFFKF